MSELFSIVSGEVPSDKETLRAVTVGLDKISQFYRKYYFDQYIKEGGSKIRFITGKKGSGKSHLLALLKAEAEDAGIITVPLSAKEVKLNDITNLYTAVISALSLDRIASRITDRLITDLGYDISVIGETRTLMDYIIDIGEDPGLTKQEIRSSIRQAFRSNPYIDSNFGAVFSQLCGEMLGLFQLEEADRRVLTAWMKAEGSIKLTTLRNLGLAPYRINKLNARSMLTSVAEILKFAGYGGLLITVDDLDVMLTTSSLAEIHYTRMQRDDTYESLRQLIDDIDSSRYVMYAFAFDKALVDNERSGLKSYQALWLRIQNEILSNRLNLFTDLLDLDSANQQLYTPQAVVEMSRRLAEAVDGKNIQTRDVSLEEAEQLIRKSRFGSLSLPLLVNQSTFRIGDEEDGKV